MRALIDPRDGRVCEVCDRDFPVATPLFWADASDGVTTRHRWNGSRFDAPPPREVLDDDEADGLEVTRALTLDELPPRVQRRLQAQPW